MIIKKIEGYDGYYITEDGKVLRELKPWISSGYKDIKLNGKHNLIHRLVALAFVNNPNSETDVNHKDGNKMNNHYSNLEWCSRSENLKHSYRELGQTPIRNFNECELFKDEIKICDCKSVKEACKIASELGGKPKQLEKHLHDKHFKIKIK